MLFSTHASHVSLLYSVCIYKYHEFIFREFYMKKRPKYCGLAWLICHANIFLNHHPLFHQNVFLAVQLTLCHKKEIEYYQTRQRCSCFLRKTYPLLVSKSNYLSYTYFQVIDHDCLKIYTLQLFSYILLLCLIYIVYICTIKFCSNLYYQILLT